VVLDLRRHFSADGRRGAYCCGSSGFIVRVSVGVSKCLGLPIVVGLSIIVRFTLRVSVVIGECFNLAVGISVAIVVCKSVVISFTLRVPLGILIAECKSVTIIVRVPLGLIGIPRDTRDSNGDRWR
jgi:hypothetical protein